MLVYMCNGGSSLRYVQPFLFQRCFIGLVQAVKPVEGCELQLFATSPQLGICPQSHKTVSGIIQRLLDLTLLRVH